MDTLALLIGVLMCLAVVNGRSFEEKRREGDPISLGEEEPVNGHTSDMRHRRRRWQMNYGYDYPTPLPSYYPERRDYVSDRNQQDLLVKIVKLLEEISVYVRRPPPPPLPPQPVYISYPVPIPVPQYTPCSSDPNKVNITSRFPEMEDTNQNWGFVTNEEEKHQHTDDGSRPISFDPILPKNTLRRPAPKVEHGSIQADNRYSTQAPQFEEAVGSAKIPVMCNAAILSCCADDKQQQKQCFTNFGCSASYDNGKGCSSESLNDALEAFKAAYSPMP